MADIWTVVSAVGSIGAAGFAGWQIRHSARDANRRSAFAQLREVNVAWKELMRIDVAAAQRDALTAYREAQPLTTDAAVYLAFLSELEDVAIGVERKMFDEDLVVRHLRSLLGPTVLTRTFLKDFQQCCGEPGAYEFLERLLVKVAETRRKLGGSTT